MISCEGFFDRDEKDYDMNIKGYKLEIKGSQGVCISELFLILSNMDEEVVYKAMDLYMRLIEGDHESDS